MIEHLPVLGVGVSLSLSAQPDPVAIVQARGGAQFVEYAGVIDVSRVQDEVERIQAAGGRVLYHPSYINFCGSFANNSHWLATTAEHIAAVGSPWFAQDCAYCFWGDSHGYSSQLGYFIPPILNEDSLRYALARIREVQQAVPTPVAIEPPPMTFVVGRMPLFSFFGRLAREADCAILLDMGHLVSYEMASGQDVCAALADLPCAQVVEVHIAGGRIKSSDGGAIYVDAHECAILEPSWQMLVKLLPHLPQLKAVCYECEGMDQDTVLTTLARLRELVRAHSSNAELVRVIDHSPASPPPIHTAAHPTHTRTPPTPVRNPVFFAQEHALFDLLFDDGLRTDFCRRGLAALMEYELPTAALQDFAVIRPDALAFDARLRTDLILAQFCRSFPLSFSLLSSFAEGLALVKSLIDSATMRQPSLSRLSFFGKRLRQLALERLDLEPELLALIDAELAMLATSQRLKQDVLDGVTPATTPALADNWLAAALDINSFVSVTLLPQSYDRLKQQLCPFSGSELWRHLNKNPLSASQRRQLLAEAEPRLLVCKAYIRHDSRCEPVIDQQTVELSEGFAPLLDHIDGSVSVNDILAQLKHLGASMAMLQSIAGGFRQLLKQGMLEPANHEC